MNLIEFTVYFAVLHLCVEISLAEFENKSHIIAFDDFDAYRVSK